MNDYLKKNINKIITIFLLMGPVLDLLTGICLHYFKINFTVGIIIRMLFLIFICLITLFTFKKKNILIPYLIIGVYFIFYIIGTLLYKDKGIFTEIQNLIKVFYFPIMLISISSFKEEVNISTTTLFKIFILYLLFIFIPLILGIGYKTYEITKVGTLGFFNAANEVGGIISILTPIMFIILLTKKNLFIKISSVLVFLIVILMVGTKTPLLSLIITLGLSLIYLEKTYITKKDYKKVGLSIIIVLVGIISLILVLPRTNFYKNIKTHLEFLEVEKVTDVFKDEKLVDHFIFSQRLTFLKNRNKLYQKANNYQKLFGIGYLDNGEEVKMIEMDYFDIYYSHGLIGFIIYFAITIYTFIKTIKKNKFSYERFMYKTSLLLIVFLSFFTGHIITAPSVSLIVIIIIIALSKKKILL